MSAECRRSGRTSVAGAADRSAYIGSSSKISTAHPVIVGQKREAVGERLRRGEIIGLDECVADQVAGCSFGAVIANARARPERAADVDERRTDLLHPGGERGHPLGALLRREVGHRCDRATVEVDELRHVDRPFEGRRAPCTPSAGITNGDARGGHPRGEFLSLGLVGLRLSLARPTGRAQPGSLLPPPLARRSGLPSRCTTCRDSRPRGARARADASERTAAAHGPDAGTVSRAPSGE